MHGHMHAHGLLLLQASLEAEQGPQKDSLVSLLCDLMAMRCNGNRVL